MDEARGLSCDVLVVGGGPVALLTALCLSQRGVRCVVAERLDKRVSLPRATRLSARSVEILLGLGITWEELEGRALPDDAAARSVICARIDEELARIDLDEDGQREGLRRAVRHPVPTLSLDQTALEEILLAGLDATRGITLRPGMRFVGFEEDEQGITSHLASMSDGPDVSVRSSYLVGADGTDSPCRTAMGVRLNGMETGTRLACVRFRADLGSRLPVPAATVHLLDPVGFGSLQACSCGWLQACRISQSLAFVL